MRRLLEYVQIGKHEARAKSNIVRTKAAVRDKSGIYIPVAISVRMHSLMLHVISTADPNTKVFFVLNPFMPLPELELPSVKL